MSNRESLGFYWKDNIICLLLKDIQDEVGILVSSLKKVVELEFLFIQSADIYNDKQDPCPHGAWSIAEIASIKYKWDELWRKMWTAWALGT